MSRAFNRLLNETVRVITTPEIRPRGYYAPIVPPPSAEDWQHDMVVR